MAFGYSVLTKGGSDTDGTSFTTASISPSAGTTLLAAIWLYDTGSALFATPAVSGNGLTWSSAGTQGFGGQVLAVLSASSPTTPTPGAVTFNCSAIGTFEGAAWMVVEITGSNITTTNGVVQKQNFNEANRTTSDSLTLPNLSAFANASNAAVAFFSSLDTGGGTLNFTAGTNFTKLDEIDQTANSDTLSLMFEYQNAEDISVNASVSAANDRLVGSAMEIALQHTAVDNALASTVDIADVVTTETDYLRTINDNAEVSEVISQAVNKGLADGVEVSDDVTPQLTANQSLEDNAEVVDSTSQAIGKNPSDSTEIADNLTQAVGKGIADGVDISESLTTQSGKPLADDSEVADTLNQAVGKNLAESLEIADDLSTQVNYAPTLEDDVEISDSVAKSLTNFMAVSVEVSDALARSLTNFIADNVEVSDNLAQTINKYINETIEVADDNQQIVALLNDLSDNAEVSDNLTQAITKAPAESLEVADSQTVDMGKVFAEVIQISDSQARTIHKNIAEVVEVDDDLTLGVFTQLQQAIADSVEITDDLTAILTDLAAPRVYRATLLSPNSVQFHVKRPLLTLESPSRVKVKQDKRRPMLTSSANVKIRIED